jgi:hypothetical protein
MTLPHRFLTLQRLRNQLHRFVFKVYIRAFDRMRVLSIMTLLTLVLYVHGVVGETPGVPPSTQYTVTEGAQSGLVMDFFCPGATAVNAKYDLCFKDSQVGNECEKTGKQVSCFPKCFCDHALGILYMTGFNQVCKGLPPCGGRAVGSPAPSLRASSFTACIAGVVSLAGVNLISV